MGIQSGGIFGKVVNKVGGVVFRVGYGKNVISAYQPIIHDKKSAPQLIQRSLFKSVTGKIKKALDAFIDSTHEGFNKKTSAYNQLVKNAFACPKSAAKLLIEYIYISPVLNTFPVINSVVYNPFNDDFQLKSCVFNNGQGNEKMIIASLKVDTAIDLIQKTFGAYYDSTLDINHMKVPYLSTNEALTFNQLHNNTEGFVVMSMPPQPTSGVYGPSTDDEDWNGEGQAHPCRFAGHTSQTGYWLSPIYNANNYSFKRNELNGSKVAIKPETFDTIELNNRVDAYLNADQIIQFPGGDTPVNIQGFLNPDNLINGFTTDDYFCYKIRTCDSAGIIGGRFAEFSFTNGYFDIEEEFAANFEVVQIIYWFRKADNSARSKIYKAVISDTTDISILEQLVRSNLTNPALFYNTDNKAGVFLRITTSEGALYNDLATLELRYKLKNGLEVISFPTAKGTWHLISDVTVNFDYVRIFEGVTKLFDSGHFTVLRSENKLIGTLLYDVEP